MRGAKGSTAESVLDFLPDIIRLQRSAPSPLPRLVLYVVLGLVAACIAWLALGRLDIVAVAHGKLVPVSFLKIVQPAEAGIVREILVREGELVEEGQVLVRMDAIVSQADGRSLEADLLRRRLQLRRIEAELTGGSMPPVAHSPPELYEQVRAQLFARRQAHADAIATEQAVRMRAIHDLESGREIQSKLNQTLPMYREQAEAWDKLARDGFAGRLLAMERQRLYVEAEQELKAHVRNMEGLKATIAQAEKRIAQLESMYRQQLHQERAEAEAHLRKLEQDHAKQEHRHALLELRAPQAGVVKDLATHTPGTVVAPGTIMLTLVPRDEPLLAEVWVANADSGFVRPEQKVRLKLSAYPFQKHGMLNGSVQHVSADAQERSGAGSAATPRTAGEPAYRALVRLDTDHLEDAAGRRHALMPGMTITAEVHIGHRTVLEYLLSPIQKVSAEAGRER